MAQWLRIHLPLQGPRVPFLLRKGSTCQGATKPMGNNDWTCTLEPMLCSKKSHCSPQLEKARAQQWSLSTAKNKHTHAHSKYLKLGKPQGGTSTCIRSELLLAKWGQPMWLPFLGVHRRSCLAFSEGKENTSRAILRKILKIPPLILWPSQCPWSPADLLRLSEKWHHPSLEGD